MSEVSCYRGITVLDSRGCVKSLYHNEENEGHDDPAYR